MSSYGPPDRYGQPADPWGDQDSWTGEPAHPGQPAHPGHSAHPGQHPGYGPGYPDRSHDDQGRYDTGYDQREGHAEGYDQREGYVDQRNGYGPRENYGRGGTYSQPGNYSQPDAPGHRDNYSQPYGYAGDQSQQYQTRPYEPQTGYQSPTQAPEWDQPVEPPKRGPGGMAIAVVVALAVLVLGGGATALYLITKGQGDQTTAGDTTATTGPTGGAPSAGPSQSGSAAAAAEGRFAAKGQCISNDGSDENPKIRIVKCAPGTFEVLARFDGTIDYKGKCASVAGYQFHYYFDSQLDALDFVLCMKRR